MRMLRGQPTPVDMLRRMGGSTVQKECAHRFHLERIAYWISFTAQALTPGGTSRGSTFEISTKQSSFIHSANIP